MLNTALKKPAQAENTVSHGFCWDSSLYAGQKFHALRGSIRCPSLAGPGVHLQIRVLHEEMLAGLCFQIQ